MRVDGRRPPLLALSLPSPTVSQAGRPGGCQRGNKVTGWWARRPVSDHMDWCCARHRSHWLTQQGSSHNRGTYSRPGPFILFLPPPPLLCLFQSLPSAASSFFSHLSLSVYPLSLHLQTLACCFLLHYLDVTEVKGVWLRPSLFPLSFPFFLIVLQVQRWFPGFLLRATHSDKCISYTGNQHFWKGKSRRRHRAADSTGSMLQTQTHTWGMSSTGVVFSDSEYICV